jgi:hypothetical protein
MECWELLRMIVVVADKIRDPLSDDDDGHSSWRDFEAAVTMQEVVMPRARSIMIERARDRESDRG